MASLWISQEVLDPMKSTFAEVQQLLSVEDPVNEPYKSKYAARELLVKLLKEAEELSEFDEHSKALQVHFLSHIGSIEIEVEELSAGEMRLKIASNIILDITNEDLIIGAKLKILNQLGLLWCMREDYEKAVDFLTSSLTCFKEFSDGTQVSNEMCIYDTDDLLTDAESLKQDPPYFHRKTKMIDQSLVYTHYYLGQVYDKLGYKDKASSSLHFTLKKQLELQDYEPLEWSRNAAMLSVYYLSQNLFPTARHLLSAATHISKEWKRPEPIDPEEDVDEKALMCKADIARTWGKYCQVLLQTSVEKQFDDPQNVDDSNADNLVVDFSAFGVDELNIPAVPAKNFEQARSIFVPGQKFFKESQDFYTFEDHCVDHTEICQDESRMYRMLANFELSLERKFQMLRRSAELLEMPHRELSRQSYLLICRQLDFELGEVYAAMADIKLEKLKTQGLEELKEHNTLSNNVNKLIQLSQYSFNLFLDSIKTEDGNSPQRFSDDNCRSALMAILNLARMSYKVVVIPQNSKQSVVHLMEAYQYYKQFFEYCQANPDQQECVEKELPLCEEMVQLLPVKILRLNASLQNSTQ